MSLVPHLLWVQGWSKELTFKSQPGQRSADSLDVPVATSSLLAFSVGKNQKTKEKHNLQHAIC